MDAELMIDQLLTIHDELYTAIEDRENIHLHLDHFKKTRDNTVKVIAYLQALTTWLPYPENTPIVGETYNVLQHYPDGWDYQIATYRPDRITGWFSNILACSLRYVTHFAPLLPLPEES